MHDQSTSNGQAHVANGSSSSATNGRATDPGENRSRAGRTEELTSNGSGISSGNKTRLNLADSDEDEPGEARAFMPLWPGSAIDKRELVQLTLQSLRDLGYESSARALEAESGLTLEHPSITAFRSAILSGDWRNAERLLIDGLDYGARRAAGGYLRLASNVGEASAVPLDSVLRRPDVTSLDSIRFMIQRQRYLELLEARQTKRALSVLRDRLTPINQNTEQLHLLSSLVMCATTGELQRRANWDGSQGKSRRRLLVDIEGAVSPSVMVPSRRLPSLLEQAQSFQKQRDPFFNLMPDAHISLLTDHESDRSAFPSEAAQVLRGHDDEVWHLEFSHDGTKLATTGKDMLVIVWSVGDEFKMLAKLDGHSNPISSVSWSPDDGTLLTTSEGDVTLWNVTTQLGQTFSEHDYTVGTAAWLPDGSFVTGGMDGKIIFWDSRGGVTSVISMLPFRIVALAVSPNGRHLVVVSNREMVGAAGQASAASRNAHSVNAPPSSGTGSSQYSESPSPASTSAGHHDHLPVRGVRSHGMTDDIGGGSRTLSEEKHRIQFIDVSSREVVGSVYMCAEMSSVCISRDSRYALINHRPNEVQLWSIERQTMIRKFTGHAMKHHVVRCGFGGIDENFIVSGSEDSQVHVWHRPSGRTIEVLSGHGRGTVNAVAWHPKDPSMLASCSDDHTIIVWRPGGRRRGWTARSAKKEEAEPASDDSLMSAAANPFPWTDVGSPVVHEHVTSGGGGEGGRGEEMDEAA